MDYTLAYKKRISLNMSKLTAVSTLVRGCTMYNPVWTALRKIINDIVYMHASIKSVPVGILEDNTDRRKTVLRIIEDIEGYDEPFIICNLGKLIERLKLWKEKLPFVRPFYAVKSNNDECMVQMLFNIGVGFDCSSTGELVQVTNIGAVSDDIVFAAPVKFKSSLKFCKERSIKMMTFDNANEVMKLAKIFPDCKPILRIAVDDSAALIKLNIKYGAESSDIPRLLSIAENQDLDIAGVSFHCGWQCSSPKVFGVAVNSSLDIIANLDDFKTTPKVLDIGGGFPGRDMQMHLFDEICQEVCLQTDSMRDQIDRGELKVISEPGSFFAAPCMDLVTKVVGKRRSTQEHIVFEYYINDGVHGAISDVLFNKTPKKPSYIIHSNEYGASKIVDYPCPSVPSYRSLVWGPTCDSFDIIMKDILLPELKDDDYLVFENMGDYSPVLGTKDFGGLPKAHVFYVIEQQYENLLRRKEEIPGRFH